MTLIQNDPPMQKSLEEFISKVDFRLPDGYLEFMRSSNGVEGQLSSSYFILWHVEELFELNEAYNVNEFAPGFFIVGTDGGDTAFAVEKESGEIYGMPFIGMSRAEARLLAKDFPDLLKALNK